MTQPYYTDDAVTLHHGDALHVARQLHTETVDCIVTSPPYYGLRDYGTPGQYGLEETPAQYVETMRALFAELRRALTPDGTLWLNLGDSYSNAPSGPAGKSAVVSATKHGVQRNGSTALPYKNLLGIPWRVALALQADGWILRNEIIWAKPNGMPEPVKDRLTNRHEHLFMFSKSPRYWFDLDAIREPQTDAALERAKYPRAGHAKNVYGDGWTKTRNPATDAESNARALAGAGRNPGDVWEIATQPFAGAHFATFPREIPRRAILAGCKPGGTVLDPFSGSGTTGLVAGLLGRRYIGVDISTEYLDLSLRTRLAQGVLDIGGAP